MCTERPDRSALSPAGGVPTGANPAPGHAAGFFSSRDSPMNDNQIPEDQPPKRKRSRRRQRIDIDPPYSPQPTDALERFRSLLARLIAKRIADNRRNPPPPAGLEET